MEAMQLLDTALGNAESALTRLGQMKVAVGFSPAGFPAATVRADTKVVVQALREALAAAQELDNLAAGNPTPKRGD